MACKVVVRSAALMDLYGASTSGYCNSCTAEFAKREHETDMHHVIGHSTIIAVQHSNAKLQ